MEDLYWKKVLESDLESLSLELKDHLEKPCVVILSGEMGAGKTTFVRKFVAQYAPKYSNTVMSPTYSLIASYGPIVHSDLYRLEESEELKELELELYQEHTDIFFIEWGLPYVPTLSRLLDIEHFYELKIEMNGEYRDISLKDISATL